jgi:LAS superfamily LD-carboxypeptidase LdcB
MASAAASMASAASQAATSAPAPGSAAPQTLSSAALSSVEAAVAAAAAAAGTDPADPDTPGEDGGARCPGNEQYAAEQPTGMRADVAAAWLAVAAAGESQRITMCLADGKRSRAQQQATYDDYVTQFGKAMADQYVLPPDKSAHVLGSAVDVQPYAAYTWLEGTAGKLGFCRIYDNEAWHFEYDAAFPDDGCPARLPHPSA